MTTLLAVYHSNGDRERCDAKCHNAKEPKCVCCCDGRYHGKREGSPELRQAVEEEQAGMLALLAELEAKGELLVTYARPSLEGKPIVADRGKKRTYQDTLHLGGSQ